MRSSCRPCTRSAHVEREAPFIPLMMEQAMNNPGTRKPSWRQSKGLWIVIGVALAIFVVTLFLRW